WAGLTANIGTLIFFKYSVFLAGTVAATVRPLGVRMFVPGAPLLQIIGLSYFTFAGMSYLLDVYFGKMKSSDSISEFVSYLVYFPKLIAGPIVRAADFLPQLRRGIRPSTQDIEIGCAYFLVGAVKKLVIADQLATRYRFTPIFRAIQTWLSAAHGLWVLRFPRTSSCHTAP